MVARFNLPTSSTPNAVEYYNLAYSDDTVTNLMYNHVFSLEIPGVYFYPTAYSLSKAQAAAAGGSPARISYTLSEDAATSIYIYDIRNMRVVYHRTFAAGSNGGAAGNNTITWDFKSDTGAQISNGMYIAQVVNSKGERIGQANFVVNE
jgi:hypothetical protein